MILNLDKYRTPFRNPARLKGKELIEQYKNSYIRDSSPDLVKAIISDFETVKKLPLSTKLFSDIFLNSDVTPKYVENLLWNMAQKTLFDFLCTDIGTLGELILEASRSSEDKEFASVYLDHIFGSIDVIEDEGERDELMSTYEVLRDFLDENL